MHVLVCGGAGYIGSHMCKMLASRGHQATVLDNLSTGHKTAVQWGKFVQGDLLVPADIDAVLGAASYTAAMHFSAKSLVGESVQHPAIYYRNNVVGTINLLDALVRHDIRNFIFSSSAAVYGNPEYSPIDEKHPARPINPYGQTKLVAEKLLADYSSAYGLRSIALRYFNAAGADPAALIGEAHDPETHLIPNILLSAIKKSDRQLKVFGNDYGTPDGTCVRDYVHVDDLGDAHVRALEYLVSGGTTDILNLGNGRGFSVMEVINAAKSVTGIDIPYVVVGRRPGDPPVLVASALKAKQVLGWSPQYQELSDIIATAWRWHNKDESQATHS